MPKGHRSVRSQGYNHLSPTTTPTTAYYPSITRSIAPVQQQQQQQQNYYSNPMPALSAQPQYAVNLPNYAVQHPMSSSSHQSHSQHQQNPYSVPLPLNMPSIPPVSIRPSSGAWNPTDDATLMAARAQGMNWQPIQKAYFPTKTSNACRKRHERLMERRSADDLDGGRLEEVAKKYMELRREIWAPLARETGEKWMVVEAKCMAQGLKNLQTSARSATRRERLLDTSAGSSMPGSHDYLNDSGIALEGVDDDDYADNPSPASNNSTSQYYGHASHGSTGSSHHSYGHSSQSMNQNQNQNQGYGQQQQSHSQSQHSHSQRHHQGRGSVSSMDMGIGAIINRHDGR